MWGDGGVVKPCGLSVFTTPNCSPLVAEVATVGVHMLILHCSQHAYTMVVAYELINREWAMLLWHWQSDPGRINPCIYTIVKLYNRKWHVRPYFLTPSYCSSTHFLHVCARQAWKLCVFHVLIAAKEYIRLLFFTVIKCDLMGAFLWQPRSAYIQSSAMEPWNL